VQIQIRILADINSLKVRGIFVFLSFTDFYSIFNQANAKGAKFITNGKMAQSNVNASSPFWVKF
jgi:hypothetical protein